MKKQIFKVIGTTLFVTSIISFLSPQITYAAEITDPVPFCTTKTDDTSENTNLSDGYRLIVMSDKTPDSYLAVSVESGVTNMYTLTYKNENDMNVAYNMLSGKGIAVEKDATVVTANDTTDTKDLKTSDEAEASNMDNISVTDAIVQSNQAKDMALPDTKTDITVAVIDSGLNPNLTDLTTTDNAITTNLITNPVFTDRIAEQTNPAYLTDTNGHGTLISSIIAKNSNAKILPIKAFNDDGTSSVKNVYLGIMEALEKKADIINLSFAGKGDSKVLNAAINYAVSLGVPVVVSAGNDNGDVKDYTPANISSAITVGSVDKDNKKADYSNYGSFIDFDACGTVTDNNMTTITEDDKEVTGTSYSAAYVSSTISKMLEKGKFLTDDQNKMGDILSYLATDIIPVQSVPDTEYMGQGIINEDSVIKAVTDKQTKIDNPKTDNPTDNTENKNTVDNSTDTNKNVSKDNTDASTVKESDKIHTEVESLMHTDKPYVAVPANDPALAKAFLKEIGYNDLEAEDFINLHLAGSYDHKDMGFFVWTPNATITNLTIRAKNDLNNNADIWAQNITASGVYQANTGKSKETWHIHKGKTIVDSYFTNQIETSKKSDSLYWIGMHNVDTDNVTWYLSVGSSDWEGYRTDPGEIFKGVEIAPVPSRNTATGSDSDEIHAWVETDNRGPTIYISAGFYPVASTPGGAGISKQNYRIPHTLTVSAPNAYCVAGDVGSQNGTAKGYLYWDQYSWSTTPNTYYHMIEGNIDGNSGTGTIKDDVNISQHTTPNTYHVYYDNNGANVGVNGEQPLQTSFSQYDIASNPSKYNHITYNSNGGSVVKNGGETIYYSFQGWALNDINQVDNIPANTYWHGNHYIGLAKPADGSGSIKFQALWNSYTLTLPEAPLKDGYYFTGWQDQWGQIYKAGQQVVINHTSHTDITYTALWTPIKVNVLYSFGSSKNQDNDNGARFVEYGATGSGSLRSYWQMRKYTENNTEPQSMELNERADDTVYTERYTMQGWSLGADMRYDTTWPYSPIPQYTKSNVHDAYDYVSTKVFNVDKEHNVNDYVSNIKNNLSNYETRFENNTRATMYYTDYTKNNYEVSGDGQSTEVTIVLHAVWDRVPEVYAKDKYYTYDQLIYAIKNNQFEDYVLGIDKGTTISFDQEDQPDWTNGCVEDSAKILNPEKYTEDYFKQLGEVGQISVPIVVKDKAHNTMTYPVRIWITNTDTKNSNVAGREGDKIQKTASGFLGESYTWDIRFIDKENFDKYIDTNSNSIRDDNETADHKNGALYPDSMWYLSSGWKKEAVKAFNFDDPEYRYSLTINTIKAIKKQDKQDVINTFDWEKYK